MDKNIEYYNVNAETFFTGTVNADMSAWRDKFETYVTDGGRILDAGCGSGRDSRAFKQHGYSVVAIDASKEMCRRASELLSQEVWQMKFDEISFEDEFDGIWACASLLHVPEKELPAIMKKLKKALTDKGVLYASFKYGEGTVMRGERTFVDFTEDTLRDFLEASGFAVKECDITHDIRPGRGDEIWVNAIGEKK
jgi:SAM-dependent methyltransferase